MFLNVGGAVLGVAVLTVISDSVAWKNGGKSNPQANLEGYRAGYYAAIAMIAIGFILSIFFAHNKGQQGEQQEGEEKGNENDEKKAEKKELSAATETASTTVGEESEGKAKGLERTAGSSGENGAVGCSNESDKKAK